MSNAFQPVTPRRPISGLPIALNLYVTKQRDKIVAHPSRVLPYEFRHDKKRFELGQHYAATGFLIWA
jgi:hypothetical protein